MINGTDLVIHVSQNQAKEIATLRAEVKRLRGQSEHRRRLIYYLVNHLHKLDVDHEQNTINVCQVCFQNAHCQEEIVHLPTCTVGEARAALEGE